MKPLEGPLKKLAKVSLDFLFNFYKAALHPFFGHSCCYQPTCSQYGREVFLKHSFLKAFFLTGKRILKCHPFSTGGFDPVPEKEMISNG